ncbi:MAG TPA: hypothetical protein VLT58_02720, partial [Polyangia bacterium]|nr:hypothetical protein [Polyangia bacterium]
LSQPPRDEARAGFHSNAVELGEAQGGGGEVGGGAGAQQRLFGAGVEAAQSAGPAAAVKRMAIEVAVALDGDEATAEVLRFEGAIVFERTVAPQHEAARGTVAADPHHSVRDGAAPGVAEDHVADGDHLGRDWRDGQHVTVVHGRRHAAATGAEAYL